MPKFKKLYILRHPTQEFERVPKAESYVMLSRRFKTLNHPWGSECAFVKLADGTGVKAYNHKWDAQKALSTQKKLAKFELAPEVFSGLIPIWGEFRVLGGAKVELRWGFVTEVVKIVRDFDIFTTQFMPLVAELKKFGISHADVTLDNVGLKGGELVLLDCGPLSTFVVWEDAA